MFLSPIFRAATAGVFLTFCSVHAQAQDSNVQTSPTSGDLVAVSGGGISAVGGAAGALGYKLPSRGLGAVSLGISAGQLQDEVRRGQIAQATGTVVSSVVGLFTVPAGAAAGAVVGNVPGAVIGGATGAYAAHRAGVGAENLVVSTQNLFADNRSPLQRRLDAAGLDAARFADNYNLFNQTERRRFESDLSQELQRREASLALREGRSFIPESSADQNTINPPATVGELEQQLGLQPGESFIPSPFGLEQQLHSSLAGSTTGLSSHIGDARGGSLVDPELERALSAAANSPFVTTVETPSGVSTGAFTGQEGLNIAGVLNVLTFDSGNLQDGDRVRLTVRDSRGVVLRRTITLTFGGSRSAVSARRGIVNVTITALNEGSSPPNTGGLRVSGEVAGTRSRNFNLSAGQSGTIAVRVLGN